MLMNKMWKIFEATGNINAYLYYRECCKLFEKEEKELINVTNVTKEEKRA